MTASPVRGSTSPLATFSGDWPEEERKQVIQVVKRIEDRTPLRPAPAGLAPWHVNRISAASTSFYVAHRWHLEETARSRSLEELLKKMKEMAT